MTRRSRRQRFYARLRADRQFLSMLLTDHFYDGPEDDEPDLHIWVPRAPRSRAT